MTIGADKFGDYGRTTEVRRQDLRTFHHIMVFLAVATVVIGGALLPGHEFVQLDVDQARQLGSAFIAAGIADTLVLHFWDRIFGKGA